ncbi:MAG: GTP-binding protein [Rhodopirellula sp.]|nr:GTP-binding protein [Rhodopirellula sp.]
MAVVAELTPPGRGAVATLRVEGLGARDVVARHFRPATGRDLSSYPPERVVFGRFGPEPGEEVIVHAASEQAVEIHCHGGHAAVARLTELLAAAGCRRTDWRQWTRSHHQDPIAAEAHIALAEARTQRAAEILLDQYQGALRRAMDDIQALLGEGQVDQARQQIDRLLARAPLGLHLTAPWQVVLAGRPNVGKSSLINSLVGYQRALVDPLPGTTRDVVTATTALDGWPVELSDTAGLRDGASPVEQAGIALAEERLAAADLAVLVFDASRPWSDEDQRLFETYPRSLVVHNKCDIMAPDGPPRREGLSTSATRGDGIDALAAAIAQRLVPEVPPAGAAVPFTQAQIEALRAYPKTLAERGTGTFCSEDSAK